ncbi:MAG: endonuclease Q family protein, partial [Candidatus Aenigmatarchaeota archaeon]
MNMQIADLHIHSHYSRATSPDMNIHELVRWSKVKGVNVLGTGDFTHPLWLKELKSLLKFNNGIYEYHGIKFVPSGEISLIYTQDKKSRRVHQVLLAPNFDVVDQINEFLDKKGRRDYDGRPIFGFSSIELVDEMMKISKDIMIIPAHVWTPWYAIFGSMSGFNSLEECFGEKTKHIHAVETGISSDPAMNWRLSFLDNVSLVSFSDSHSGYPWRLGREACIFNIEGFNYEKMIHAIKTKEDFLFTVETSPSYGKYHYDGHRNCEVSFSPEETKKHNGICPVCKKPLTIGVANRIEELADRPEGFVPKGAIPFKSLIPLSEIISALIGSSIASKKTWEIYNTLMNKFGTEFNVLLNAEESELKKIVKDRVAEAIIKNRKGTIKIQPGFDGEYGKPIFNEDEISAPKPYSKKGPQKTLGEF